MFPTRDHLQEHNDRITSEELGKNTLNLKNSNKKTGTILIKKKDILADVVQLNI